MLFIFFKGNLADRIVNDVSENGVHVIMLNVDTKSHKDLVEFIIDAFHNVQNMSIVCSNICIGRIITMVSISFRTFIIILSFI